MERGAVPTVEEQFAAPHKHSPAGLFPSGDLATDHQHDQRCRQSSHNLPRVDCGTKAETPSLRMSKCDLHVHSRHSARSEEWLFRRFDFPDSYTDPRELYRRLLKLGMDYVTITDHDTIEGCLQIADLPQTLISEQVTTHFPQDKCKIHLLVWGISE